METDFSQILKISHRSYGQFIDLEMLFQSVYSLF